MKKAIALLVVLAFVVCLAGISSAVSPSQIRSYIGVLNSKLNAATNAKDWARVAKLKGMIADQKQRLAEAEGTAPSPVAVPPPPAPSMASPAPAGALFGWGLDVDASLGYVMNKSVLSLRGDVLFADPLGLGPIVGLSQDAVKYKLGLGYTTGKDTNDKDWRSVPIFVDGLIMIPADVLGGIESYLGGGINYVVTRSGSKAGTIGGQIYYGIQGDIGLGGKTFAQVGYTILRSGSTAPVYSTKGLSVEIGQALTL